MTVAKETYNRAQVALEALGMLDKSDTPFRKLLQEDMRPFEVSDDTHERGDSHRVKTSWIWEDLSFVKDANDGKIKAYYESGKSLQHVECQLADYA